jgi:hypothetical protein
VTSWLGFYKVLPGVKAKVFICIDVLSEYIYFVTSKDDLGRNTACYRMKHQRKGLEYPGYVHIMIVAYIV